MIQLCKCREERYCADEIIIPEGAPDDRLGLVISGTVNVEKLDLSGNRNIFASLRTGELFSEAFAFSDKTYMTVSIRAASDSRIMLISRDWILEDPILMKNMLRLIGNKMFLFDQRIEIISKRKTSEKLLLYLQQQKEYYQTNSFIIPYNRQELADFLGVDRSGLSVEIHRLVKCGILETKGSWFRLNI